MELCNIYCGNRDDDEVGTGCYHVGTGCHLYNQDEERVSEKAAKQRIPDSHVEVEDVCRHEQTEQSCANEIDMNLQNHIPT